MPSKSELLPVHKCHEYAGMRNSSRQKRSCNVFSWINPRSFMCTMMPNRRSFSCWLSEQNRRFYSCNTPDIHASLLSVAFITFLFLSLHSSSQSCLHVKIHVTRNEIQIRGVEKCLPPPDHDLKMDCASSFESNSSMISWDHGINYTFIWTYDTGACLLASNSSQRCKAYYTSDVWQNQENCYSFTTQHYLLVALCFPATCIIIYQSRASLCTISLEAQVEKHNLVLPFYITPLYVWPWRKRLASFLFEGSEDRPWYDNVLWLISRIQIHLLVLQSWA